MYFIYCKKVLNLLHFLADLTNYLRCVSVLEEVRNVNEIFLMKVIIMNININLYVKFVFTTC